MKYCPFCGSGLQENMIFCPQCGKRFQGGAYNPEAEQPAISTDMGMPDECTASATENNAAIAVDNNVTEKAAIPAETPVKKKKRTPLLVSALVLIIAVVAGITVLGDKNNEDAVSITDAANSVLYLEVYDDNNNLTATASGFVIEDGTTLVTNYHVIEDAYHIIAWTPDGEKSVDVSNIVVYDEDADLAVLQCDSNIGVQPLVLGDSETVKQGDAIYAVGYPLGLAHTLSDGVVSSRYVDEYGTDILQITAPISSGSSGGALLNSAGKVIGVICASYIDGQNMNLAVAVSTLISLQSDASEEDYVSLNNFYRQSLHAKELIDVLANKAQSLNEEVIVRGFVSVIEIPDDLTIGMLMVCSPEEVIDLTLHGYPFRSEAEIIAHEYRWELLSNQQAIEIFSSTKNKAFANLMPGDYITVKGVLCETENAEALHDYTANTLYLKNPELIASE